MLSHGFVLGLFPVVLLGSTIIIYILLANWFGGNIFHRGDGKFKPFAYAQPFISPIEYQVDKITQEGISSWHQVSFWAWPLNLQALSNIYIYIFITWVIYFSVVAYYQLKSISESDTPEKKEEIQKSILICGIGTFLEMIVFSILMYAFFSSESVKAFHF